MALSNEITTFASNVDFYVAFQDYYMNRDKMTSENTEKLQNSFFAEMEAKSGVSRSGLSVDAWIAHPSVKWAAFAVVDAVVNAILPKVVTPAFSTFADFRFTSYGDIVKFRVMPSQLYTVSKGAHGERTTFRQKDYAQDVIVAPVEHIVTVYTDMYRVLAGKEDVTEFISRVVLAIERAMYSDAVNAMVTALDTIPAGDLNVTGAFSMKKLVKMAESVQVANAGVKPVIAGSATALLNVLPDSSLGYRGNFDADGGSIQLIKNVVGYDILRLEQAQGKNGLVLPDDKLFVISPAQDKLIKGVVTNALTNSNQFYDNADITSNFTMRKDWDFVYASSAKAGIYKITE